METRLKQVLPLLSLLALSGCELVGGILEFGFWVGVISILILVAIVWAVMRLFR